MTIRYDVWFTEDAAAFLSCAGDRLAEEPTTGTVLATNARRRATAVGPEGRPAADPDSWFAVVSGPGAQVAGLAMRIAPHPPYLLAMPDAAAVALADAVLERGEVVGGASGLRPSTDAFAERVAASTGREAEVTMHTRLFQLGTLVEPRAVPGRLRPVQPDEADLALDWIHRFFLDADEQAGRAPGSAHRPDDFTMADLEQKLREEVLWFWVDDTGRPVHLSGANPPAFGVTRIGPVFTPRQERGRGWAGAAVAEISRTYRDQGVRVTLFTDQANPTSNRLYTALGYLPVADTVDVRLRVSAPVPAS